MSEQVDKSVTTTSVVLISGLVLLAVVLFMVAALVGVIGKVAPDDNSRKQAAALERIKPVSRVSFEQPKPVVAANLSGSDVYNKVCAACHATGTLGAPKTGAKDQWSPRFAQGLDTLVTHAVNGIRAMPPKGGAPTMTDANMRDAVIYMLGESGIKVEGAAAPAPAAPAAAPTAAPAAAPASAPAASAAPAAAPTAAPATAPPSTAAKPLPSTIPAPPISTPAATPPAFIQSKPGAAVPSPSPVPAMVMTMPQPTVARDINRHIPPIPPLTIQNGQGNPPAFLQANLSPTLAMIPPPPIRISAAIPPAFLQNNPVIPPSLIYPALAAHLAPAQNPPVISEPPLYHGTASPPPFLVSHIFILPHAQ